MKQISLPSLKRFSLLPLAVVAISTTMFAILDIRVSILPPLLFPILQTLFIFVAYATAAYFAAVNFRRTGSLEILLFGATLLIFGTSATLAGWLSPVGGVNLVTTIHNVSALLGSLLLLIVMALLHKDIPPIKQTSRLHVSVLIYGATIIFLGLLTVLTLKRLMPTFFEASGPTPLRQIVYGTATVLLGISTSWSIVLYRRSRADFLYWCCLGFTLMIIGFTAGLFIGRLSDPLSWIARFALYLTGLYLLVAGLAIRAEAKQKRIGVQEVVDRFLKQSRFNYGNLVESLTDGVISIDEQGRVLMWNRAAEKIFGYSRSEVVGLLLPNLVMPNEYAESLMSQLMSLPLEKDAQPAAKTIELMAKRRNGEEFPVEISLSPSRLTSGRSSTSDVGAIATLVIRDVTDRKRAEQALQQRTLELQHLTENLEQRVKERTTELANLSSQLVSAQENERRRVSYDLHDNVWQTLLTIRFNIESLFSRQDDVDRTALHNKSKEVMADILGAVGRIRSMQGDLWPYVLDDIGILATIDWYCRDFEKNHPGLKVENRIGIGEDEVPSAVKIVIYRVMQEAMSNVVKHSQATRVSLSLINKDHSVELAIVDNGIGFDPEEMFVKRNPLGGSGLLSVKARTELSGGILGVESVKGNGTTVRASWSLPGNS